MNAEQYYAKNVLLHGQDLPEVNQPAFDRLPQCPSEADYALFWLAQEQIRGAILDVGCAALSLLTRAGARFHERQGVDIVPSPSWQMHPSIVTQTCNVDQSALPFVDERFDAVTCLMVLEHVFDPFHCVRELRRVCKKTGRVVIGVPNIAGLKRRLELLFGKLPITSARFSFSEHNFTKTSLDWLLKREGLKPLRWAAQGKFPKLKMLRPSLLGNDFIVLAEKIAPNPELPFPF